MYKPEPNVSPLYELPQMGILTYYCEFHLLIIEDFKNSI